ncbi:MAG TPA: hypothetical protein VJ083_02105 [Sedimentibacter sp.]|jgi:hypothetical protein|nr:hypothetical protein [Sedimentibacter sp.]
MKKVLAFIIISTIILSFGTQSLAMIEESPTSIIKPAYTYISSFGAALEINSIGVATCEGIMSHTLTDGTCELVIELKKLDSNKNWDTIATWTSTGLQKCADYRYRAVSRGTYRVYVTAKVYDSSGNLVESQLVHSITDTY